MDKLDKIIIELVSLWFVLYARKKERNKQMRKVLHTVYRLSIDQPLNVRFRVSVGATHQTTILFWG